MGATGVRVGALPFMPIQCVPLIWVEKSIVEVSQLFKGISGRVVYGDTDSNYVTFDDCSRLTKRSHAGTEAFSRE